MNISYYENLISHLANRIWLNEELKRSAMQSVVEDVDYVDVSESECKMIETRKTDGKEEQGWLDCDAKNKKQVKV